MPGEHIARRICAATELYRPLNRLNNFISKSSGCYLIKHFAASPNLQKSGKTTLQTGGDVWTDMTNKQKASQKKSAVVELFLVERKWASEWRFAVDPDGKRFSAGMSESSANKTLFKKQLLAIKFQKA